MSHGREGVVDKQKCDGQSNGGTNTDASWKRKHGSLVDKQKCDGQSNGGH